MPFGFQALKANTVHTQNQAEHSIGLAQRGKGGGGWPNNGRASSSQRFLGQVVQLEGGSRRRSPSHGHKEENLVRSAIGAQFNKEGNFKIAVTTWESSATM